jgi:hypothetical protein
VVLQSSNPVDPSLSKPDCPLAELLDYGHAGFPVCQQAGLQFCRIYNGLDFDCLCAGMLAFMISRLQGCLFASFSTGSQTARPNASHFRDRGPYERAPSHYAGERQAAPARMKITVQIGIAARTSMAKSI